MMLEYNHTVNPDVKDEVSQKIRKEYLKDAPLTRDNFDQLAQVLHYSHRKLLNNSSLPFSWLVTVFL